MDLDDLVLALVRTVFLSQETLVCVAFKTVLLNLVSSLV